MNALMIANAINNEVNFLSMSARGELEPGPGRSGPESRNVARRLGLQIMSREAQAKARAVGWGGFTGG